STRSTAPTVVGSAVAVTGATAIGPSAGLSTRMPPALSAARVRPRAMKLVSKPAAAKRAPQKPPRGPVPIIARRMASSGPDGEGEPRAGAGRAALARDIAGPGDGEMLQRAGGTDPVADLRAAAVQFQRRQCGERRAVAEAGQHLAVERL